jgi:hypothetical protein
MRSSWSGTQSRVSSSVDQITCSTPAWRAASAILRACSTSFSGEKCSQKKVTQYAPYAPSNAAFRLVGSSTSAPTTSTPMAASSRLLSESGLRVTARPSSTIARTSPPPWAPVAPSTAMIFFSDMDVSPPVRTVFGTGHASWRAARTRRWPGGAVWRRHRSLLSSRCRQVPRDGSGCRKRSLPLGRSSSRCRCPPVAPTLTS